MKNFLFLIRAFINGINFLFNKLGFKIFISRFDKFHLPIILNKYFWDTFYENSTEIKLYNEAMVASKSSKYDNPYKQLRFYSLQNIFRHVINNSIEGEVVECGVWKGHSAYILSTLMEDTKKELLIFDSFEGGLSEKKEEDKYNIKSQTKKQIKAEKLWFASSEDQVKSSLSKFKNIKYYKGWIPTRFKEVENKKFSFVHIDVDLYQPTLDSLNFFYKRLNNGGIIVIDDYGCTQFPGSKKAVEEFLDKHNPSFFYKVPFGSCFLIK